MGCRLGMGGGRRVSLDVIEAARRIVVGVFRLQANVNKKNSTSSHLHLRAMSLQLGCRNNAATVATAAQAAATSTHVQDLSLNFLLLLEPSHDRVAAESP